MQVGKSEESIKGLTNLLQRADLYYFGKLLGDISGEKVFQSLRDLPNFKSKSIAGKLANAVRQVFIFPSLNILSPLFPMTLCCAVLHRQ